MINYYHIKLSPNLSVTSLCGKISHKANYICVFLDTQRETHMMAFEKIFLTRDSYSHEDVVVLAAQRDRAAA